MENLVDPNKGISLYIQVKNILAQRVQEKVWLPNTLIPTEQELMEEFNVSRTTLRQAITILVQDGLLEKKQGKGTFVKSQHLVGSAKLKGFAEEALEKGMTPMSKLIRAEFRKDLYYEKSMLNVADDEEVLLIERIRFADKMPVAIERTCWPANIGKILMKCDLNTAYFYEVLEKSDVMLFRATEKITAISATMNEADLLGIRSGEALLAMERLSFGFDDRPIEFTKTKFRSDQYHYDIELTR